jgi:hypothetical protein
MRAVCLSIVTIVATVLATAACTHRTSWVDVDASGCNEARVSAMSKDSELVHQMGAVCALNGKYAAEELRCHGHTLQVACTE